MAYFETALDLSMIETENPSKRGYFGRLSLLRTFHMRLHRQELEHHNLDKLAYFSASFRVLANYA
jgi:hypothetical protein